MLLNKSQKKRLRSLGHNLNPVVTVASKGLSNNVMEEINRALGDHELIKVKLAVADRQIKRHLIAVICKRTSANLIQRIGNIALVYRHNACADAKKSNLPY
jgi:RNA-binding protein